MSPVRVTPLTEPIVLQVIAFTCCFITVIVMVAATSTADWIIGEGWREGLFAKCVAPNAHLPLPFDIPEEIGCSKARSAGEFLLAHSAVWTVSSVQSTQTSGE